jgi:hypothetical protein
MDVVPPAPPPVRSLPALPPVAVSPPALAPAVPLPPPAAVPAEPRTGTLPVTASAEPPLPVALTPAELPVVPATPTVPPLPATSLMPPPPNPKAPPIPTLPVGTPPPLPTATPNEPAAPDGDDSGAGPQPIAADQTTSGMPRTRDVERMHTPMPSTRRTITCCGGAPLFRNRNGLDKPVIAPPLLMAFEGELVDRAMLEAEPAPHLASTRYVETTLGVLWYLTDAPWHARHRALW